MVGVPLGRRVVEEVPSPPLGPVATRARPSGLKRTLARRSRRGGRCAACGGRRGEGLRRTEVVGEDEGLKTKEKRKKKVMKINFHYHYLIKSFLSLPL